MPINGVANLAFGFAAVLCISTVISAWAQCGAWRLIRKHWRAVRAGREQLAAEEAAWRQLVQATYRLQVVLLDIGQEQALTSPQIRAAMAEGELARIVLDQVRLGGRDTPASDGIPQ